LCMPCMWGYGTKNDHLLNFCHCLPPCLHSQGAKDGWSGSQTFPCLYRVLRIS
jgi:hypothetical protein